MYHLFKKTKKTLSILYLFVILDFEFIIKLILIKGI